MHLISKCTSGMYVMKYFRHQALSIIQVDYTDLLKQVSSRIFNAEKTINSISNYLLNIVLIKFDFKVINITNNLLYRTAQIS